MEPPGLVPSGVVAGRGRAAWNGYRATCHEDEGLFRAWAPEEDFCIGSASYVNDAWRMAINHMEAKRGNV